jgi:hypothetical protein
MLLSGPPNVGAAFAFARDVFRGADPPEPPGAGHDARRPLGRLRRWPATRAGAPRPPGSSIFGPVLIRGGLTALGGVAGQAALGPGEQGDPVVVGEGAAAHGLRGGAAAMQGATAGRTGKHDIDAAVL